MVRMLELTLEPAAVRRLLSSVVATATKGGPLSPERAGRVQALAARLGLGFQELADATRDPKVKKPASRPEAEATYLAAAVLLRDDRKARRALEELGKELDLGLSLVELDRLSKEDDPLAGVTVAERKEKEKKPARRPGAKSDASAPKKPEPKKQEPAKLPLPLPVLAALVGSALFLLIMVGVAVALVTGGGKDTPPPPPPTTTVAGTPRPAPPVDAAAEFRKAVSAWNRLQGQARVDVAELARVREVMTRAVAAGKGGDAAAQARAREASALLASEAFQELWVRSSVEVMRGVDEAFEQALQDGDLAGARRRLESVPEALREVEHEWFAGREQTLKRGEGYALEVKTFLAARRAGVEALREARALHARGLEQNVAATKAHHDLVDWFRSQKDHSLAVFQAELALRKARKLVEAEEERRTLSLIESDLPAFFDRVPGETLVELLDLLVDRDLIETAKQLLPPDAWADLPVQPLLKRLQRLTPKGFYELALHIPAIQWMRFHKEHMLALLRPLSPYDKCRISIMIPAEAWFRCTAEDVKEHVKGWPPVLIEIFARFLDAEQAAGVLGRATPAEPPPAQEGQATGSGFYVGPNHVVTNAHVVGRAAEVLVQTAKGDVRCKVVARDAALDLALIEIATPGRPLALAAPAVLVDVFAYGYGSVSGTTSLLLTTSGRVAAMDPAKTTIIFTAHVNPGNSGGPLVDGDGRWVGVVNAKSVSTVAGEDSLGIAIHGELAQRWLATQGVRATADPARARGDKPDDAVVRESVVRIVRG